MPDTPWSDEAVRERLALLLKHHSQAEIARVTGATRAAVNRYVHGARIPAELCGALARELHVNPAWLLTGEGATYLTDVTSRTGETASGLLELVEAMGAVSRMKLGALAGKQRQKVLRELHEALESFERLREKLNKQTRGLFSEMLEELEQALWGREVGEAEALLRACRQASRLCSDEMLHARLAFAESEVAYRAGDWRASIEAFRRYLRFFAQTGFPDSRDLGRIYTMVRVLRTAGFHREARRVVRSVLLDAEASADATEVLLLRISRGVSSLQLGDYAEGRDEILDAWPGLPEPHRAQTRYARSFALLLCRALTPSELAALPEIMEAEAAIAVAAATVSENPDDLRTTIERHEREFASSPGVSAGAAQAETAAREVLAVLEGRCPEKTESARPPGRVRADRPEVVLHFRQAVTAAQVFRICGDVRAARAHTLAAQEMLDGMTDLSPGIFQQARHAKNVLRCLTGEEASPKDQEIRAKAEQWVHGRIAQGCSLFQCCL